MHIYSHLPVVVSKRKRGFLNIKVQYNCKGKVQQTTCSPPPFFVCFLRNICLVMIDSQDQQKYNEIPSISYLIDFKKSNILSSRPVLI